MIYENYEKFLKTVCQDILLKNFYHISKKASCAIIISIKILSWYDQENVIDYKIIIDSHFITMKIG